MKFTITAGHGGTDPGNTWGGYKEADLMLELRHLVAIKLRLHGHTVLEDGERGINWTLNEAAKLIADADLAVELHTNALTRIASGVEVVSQVQHKDISQRLAHAIGGVLMIPTRRDNGWFSHVALTGERGFQPAYTRRGGIIVEVFFQSNPKELAAYLSKNWLVASAIARTLHEYAVSSTAKTGV